MSHLEIPARTTWEWGWPVVRWNEQGIPLSVDLSGYSVRAQIRPAPGAIALLHEWSTAAGNAWITPHTVQVWDTFGRTLHTLQTAMVVLHVDSSTSGAWRWVDGVWDLKVYAPTPAIWEDRLDGGTVTVSPAVTVP